MSTKESLEKEKLNVLELLKKHNIHDEMEVSRLFTILDVYEEELKAQNEELLEKEQILLNSRKDLLSIFEYAPVAFILIDSKNIIVTSNEKARDVFGYKINRIPKLFYSFFDDKSNVNKFLNWIENDENAKFTIKIKDSDEKLKWLDLYCVNSNFEGKKTTLIAALDVTHDKNYYDNILNIINVQNTISIVTNGRELLFVNKEFLDFFKYDTMEHYLQHHKCICEKFEAIDGFFHLGLVKDKKDWIPYIQIIPEKDRVVAIKNYLGNLNFFTVRVTKFQNDTYVVTFLNITEAYQEKMTLRNKVNHDVLTDAFNREFFNNNINYIIESYKNDDCVIGIGFIDIDDFKNVNDTYGHDLGDIVLQNLANLLKQKTREDDFAIRWGGEEFILLLKVKSEKSLFHILENIRIEIENTQICDFQNITCSIGGTIFKDNIENTIKIADENMYKSKRNGKNQVTV